MTFNLAECSIRVSRIHIVGFHCITLWVLLRFFSTTTRSFYDDYFNYRSIFSSLLWMVAVQLGGFFIRKFDCIILTPVGFCVISLWTFSWLFLNHSYYVYSIYIPSYNSFLETVYPVGVTTNRSCFTRRISHNSRNLYRICTKVGTEIPFNVPVLCTKFQLDPSMRLRFIAIFLSVRKDEE